MLYLTYEQHRQVLRRLLEFGKSRATNVPAHPSGLGYTSLMMCFLLHSLSSAETLLRIAGSFGDDWFPVTIGYTIARAMFEVDVTAHYISKEPTERARLYIEFGAVLKKRQMDACLEHRNSKDSQWREAMNLMWQHHWAPRQSEILKRFEAVAIQFRRLGKRGKQVDFQNWSGKTVRQMATEVDHLEAYDVFYTELSSFTHADVHLANRFLQLRPDGPVWSQRDEDREAGNVFRHAASFLTCYLELFGRQFRTWSQAEVLKCWRT